ncbi:hypothetical protein EJB05_12636 [Eragrostis curvula]|uniref:ACT domain-containing protein ACR n=1 Tax=Eragrostis curvula TaxID=38414 RepID=A0A5J9VTM8_9POAL|nr:hypothetical protein EJB05_12636 [Eragrostis curvula]
MEWLDEYEKLVIRMNTPRAVFDNAVGPTPTLVQVDSVRKRGVLLEAVQVLADLDLRTPPPTAAGSWTSSTSTTNSAASSPTTFLRGDGEDDGADGEDRVPLILARLGHLLRGDAGDAAVPAAAVAHANRRLHRARAAWRVEGARRGRGYGVREEEGEEKKKRKKKRKKGK